MTSHQWKKDKDGAESCAREGCTVRRRPFRRGSDRYEWQKMRRSLWRHEAHRPIPPCTGKEVEESAAVQAVRLAADAGLPVRYVPAPAPSPLEVVQKIDDDLATAWLWALEKGGPTMAQRFAESRAALAKLEESIRADELAMAIIRAEDDARNNPLTSTSMRLRVRLSEVRCRNESLETWEASIRRDEREKCAEECDRVGKRSEARGFYGVASV